MKRRGFFAAVAAIAMSPLAVVNKPELSSAEKIRDLMRKAMRNNGNAGIRKYKKHNLADLYISPENIEDIRKWWGID
jgi:hypothetical protein